MNGAPEQAQQSAALPICPSTRTVLERIENRAAGIKGIADLLKHDLTQHVCTEGYTRIGDTERSNLQLAIAELADGIMLDMEVIWKLLRQG